MSYKPKFCCQCGVPVERTKWTLLTSRRFCDLCETDYQLEDWIPRVVIAVCVLFGIFGFGATFFQKPEKPLTLTSGSAANSSKNAINAPVSINANTQLSAKTQETNTAAARQSVKPTVEPATIAKAEKVEKQEKETSEPVYFCGAETKKGSPCTRRVKGGGRCWQHAGKPAMLPPEKLIASR